MRKFRTITVQLSDVRKAMERAQGVSDNWHTELIEILLIPKIYRRWQQANARDVRTIHRHRGLSTKGLNQDDNRRVNETAGWDRYAGYVLSDWNNVRSEYFSHAPTTTWDGVRRETHHSFIESLRIAALDRAAGQTTHHTVLENLRTFGIRVV